MQKIKGLKIFICLILTLTVALFWGCLQCSMTSDVGHTRYEGAVFVQHEAGYLYQAG